MLLNAFSGFRPSTFTHIPTMAKKGGVQQLQADINTDEDFEKFLERPGLLVLDVYSEWCGPCLGMVGSLKKIKLELGGDNLHLAVCKADTISYLKRFHNKSEPVWLFVIGGKAINLMFGTNVPKLMKLIEAELGMLQTPDLNRPLYDITELQPEEVAMHLKKEECRLAAELTELKEKERKRREYLNYVTDTIMENLPDIGVTVFGPQVTRDMFKKIMEPADTLKIQCKDRKVTQVSKENFALINYACENPLEPDVLKQMEGKELLLCFWKMPEECQRPVEEMLTMYGTNLTKQRVDNSPSDDIGEEERTLPPILSPLQVSFEVEVNDDEVEANDKREKQKSGEQSPQSALEPDEPLTLDGADPGIDEEGGEEDFNELNLEFDTDEANQAAEKKEKIVPEPAKPRKYTKTVVVPPIWVPSNHRTHAALIYVFFPQQTAPFLPPDPIPEPPHIVMAFDAYKKKDLIGIAERYRQDIPFYGFFTTDDPNDTTYLANSVAKYLIGPHISSDKIVLKVYRQTPDTMLLLAGYGPSYVSENTVIGHEDALKFFPKSFKTAEQEEEELRRKEDVALKKKKKSKKARAAERSSISKSATGEAVEDERRGSGEEVTTTTSGEESGDSMPPSGEAEDMDGDGDGGDAAELAKDAK